MKHASHKTHLLRRLSVLRFFALSSLGITAEPNSSAAAGSATLREIAFHPLTVSRSGSAPRATP